MRKKGQAAMEFLMTYGWAILVVLVAIAALAYFGVLSPGRFLPKSATLEQPFSVDDFKVVHDGTATFVIRNGGAETVNNVTLTVESQQCTPANTQISQSGTQTFTCTGLTTGGAGDKYSADMTLSYTPVGGIAHTVTGKVTTKYE